MKWCHNVRLIKKWQKVYMFLHFRLSNRPLCDPSSSALQKLARWNTHPAQILSTKKNIYFMNIIQNAKYKTTLLVKSQNKCHIMQFKEDIPFYTHVNMSRRNILSHFQTIHLSFFLSHSEKSNFSDLKILENADKCIV